MVHCHSSSNILPKVGGGMTPWDRPVGLSCGVIPHLLGMSTLPHKNMNSS